MGALRHCSGSGTGCGEHRHAGLLSDAAAAILSQLLAASTSVRGPTKTGLLAAGAGKCGFSDRNRIPDESHPIVLFGQCDNARNIE